jgi:hypothetical protein
MRTDSDPDLVEIDSRGLPADALEWADTTASEVVRQPVEGTAPQCDSASIRHRVETAGYGGSPLARLWWITTVLKQAGVVARSGSGR